MGDLTVVVSSVTNMKNMFDCCDKFDQPLGEWNVSSVIDMCGMFFYCKKFNPLRETTIG